MKIASNGGSGSVGNLRSPMGKSMNGLIKKGSMNPGICPNTIMKPAVSTRGARVRSAQTGGKVVQPF